MVGDNIIKNRWDPAINSDDFVENRYHDIEVNCDVSLYSDIGMKFGDKMIYVSP